MSKTKVLYISYDGMTDPLGQSQVIPYLQGLTKAGYSFTLLSCEKPENYARNKEYIAALLKDSNIDWQPIMYRKSPPVLSTILDIRDLRKKAFELHRKQGFSIVHCRSYISSLVGLEMKKKFGTKFIFDMRGFWADERVDGNLWNLSNPLYKSVFNFFKKKEKQFLERADAIISLTHEGQREMTTWGISAEAKSRIQVIPCCVDTDLFTRKRVTKQQLKELREQLNIREGQFVVSYLGSIGTWYLLDEMLLFFKELQKQVPQAVFLFISPRDAHSTIREGMKRNKISESAVRITESPRNEVPVYLSLSDYSLFFIKPSYSKKSSSPTKQGEIMAMGIPVICNAGVGDTDMIVEKYKSGTLVHQLSNDHYAKVIDEIKNSKFDPEAIITGSQDYFSLQKGIHDYLSVYKQVEAN